MSETTQSDDRLSGTVMATGHSTAADSAEAGAMAARQAKEQLDTDEVDFCQVFCSASYDFDGVLEGLREHVGSDAEVIGGASHTPFTEHGIHSVGEQSVSVALITSDTIRFFTGMGTGVQEDVSGCIRQAARELPTRVEGYPHLTAIIVPDGLAIDGEELTMTVRQRLGTNVSFVGGGPTSTSRTPPSSGTTRRRTTRSRSPSSPRRTPRGPPSLTATGRSPNRTRSRRRRGTSSTSWMAARHTRCGKTTSGRTPGRSSTSMSTNSTTSPTS